jgi:hypothetical protein
MKALRLTMTKLALFASAAWLVSGGGGARGGSDVSGPADEPLQVEFTVTAKMILPVVSAPNRALISEAPGIPHMEKQPLCIITEVKSADIRRRIEAVHALDTNLKCDEVAALCAFLKAKPAAEEKERDGSNWLKNDILNVLREQDSPPPNFTGLLTEIYRDPAQDDVMRDYAIQHLIQWYEQGAMDATDARERIRLILKEATSEPGSIAGTALLGWHRLCRHDAAFDPAEVDWAALQLALSDATDDATRLTAIQVCAERGLKAALPKIKLLANVTDCVPLRLSAEAAARRLGDSQTAPLPRHERIANAAARDEPQFVLRQSE